MFLSHSIMNCCVESDILLSRCIWERSIEKNSNAISQTTGLRNGSWMLWSHAGFIPQVDNECFWLLTKSGLDEGGIVDTFAEQDSGSYLEIVRIKALQFFLWSNPVSYCSHNMEVCCDVLVWTDSGQCFVLLMRRVHSRILRYFSMECSLGMRA